MVARGSWQRAVWAAMTDGGVRNPVAALRGKAGGYATKYQDSFDHLVRRARANGYTVEMVPGPRGGKWSAVWSARKER